MTKNHGNENRLKSRGTLRKFLSEACKGAFTRESIARKLGMTEGEVDLVLSILVSHGFIPEETLNCAPSLCSKCFLREACYSNVKKGYVKFYRITEKGRRILEEDEKTGLE